MARAPLANWVYNYSSTPGTWLQILRESGRPLAELPLPRFAHQIAYIPSTKSLFLHGGNAGRGFSDGTYHESVPSTPAAVDARPESTQSAPATMEDSEHPEASERRLDDFWRMDLKRCAPTANSKLHNTNLTHLPPFRPGPEGTIRRAQFEIRKQQFREMCEDDAPIKALSFLQTQVSNVVDHSNPKETEVFRGLLTHLLSPKPSTSATPFTTAAISPTTSNSSGTGSSLEREDTREVSNRPQKRSRGERGEEGSWTSSVPEPSPSASPVGSSVFGSNIHNLVDNVDPLETRLRGDDAQILPGARYKQRTEVFENILKLVMESEKQPTESLLDLIEQRDRCHAQGRGM